MRLIVPLSLFESSSEGLSPEAEDFLNKGSKGKWNYDPRNKKVSVEGDFDCSYQDLTDFKGVKFSNVTGNFDCSNNDLESLDGCPNEVGLSFNCSDNLLKDLEGGPILVGKNFECAMNKLTSLQGSPEKVGGLFSCSYNRLQSLEGGPESVGGTYNCIANKLTSLKGIPEVIFKNLACQKNKLVSFSGFPNFVLGSLRAKENEIENFDDFKTNIIGDFDLSSNKLKNLIGLRAPERGVFIFDGNPLSSLDKTALSSVLMDMRKNGLNFEDSVLLKGVNFKPRDLSSFSGSSGLAGTPQIIPPGAYEKLPDQQKKANISLLSSLIDDPKKLYSVIQKNPEGFAITSFIEKEMPELWEKIKNIGRAKLSAEMGDLFF